MRHLRLKTFLFLWGFLVVSFSAVADGQQVLPMKQAFPLDAHYRNGQLLLSWQIKPGYYLYREQVKIFGERAHLKSVYKPPGQTHHDRYLGQTTIYQNQVTVVADVIRHHSAPISLQLTYQGCAAAGFCYPPMSKQLVIDAQGKVHIQSPKMRSAHHSLSQSMGTDSLHEPIPSISPGWFLLSSFGFGLLLAFTPCVLPMLPIISSLILGGRQHRFRQSLWASFCYIQGMAMMYAVIGIMIAWVGLGLQVWLQSPWVLGGMSLLMVGLACSMLGWFNVTLPSGVTNAINELQNRLSNQSYWGLMLMGALSGLLCSPCVSAPTATILLYIAQTGDRWFGGGALYLFAIGMGTPLLLVALLGRGILPKSGPWMVRIRQFCGFLMFAGALFFIQRLLANAFSLGLWILLVVAFVVWWGNLLLKRCRHYQRRWLALLILGGGAAGVGCYQQMMTNQEVMRAPQFVQVDSLSALKHQLRLAKAQGQVAMVDYYADWCAACQVYKYQLFPREQVRQQLASMRLIQVDATRYNAGAQTILSHYQVLGLPTIDFFSPINGQRLTAQRISGELSGQQLTKHLAALNEMAHQLAD